MTASPLRAVLAAVRSAGPGVGLDEIAKRLDLSRDEVDAMVGYWEERGVLSVTRLGGGCVSARCADCSGCGFIKR